MAQTLAQRLVGTWRHSHEEDTAAEAVYRGEGFDFPPARGRVGYAFEADGSCTYIGISPRDGAARQPCTWRLREGEPPEIEVTLGDGRRQVLSVVSLDRDRLVVKKGAR